MSRLLTKFENGLFLNHIVLQFFWSFRFDIYACQRGIVRKPVPDNSLTLSQKILTNCS